MQNSENFSAPIKATSRRPAYSPALYQIQSVSFRCQIKIRKGQAGETAYNVRVAIRLQSVMVVDVDVYGGAGVEPG